jgi:hypothetical protein
VPWGRMKDLEELAWRSAAGGQGVDQGVAKGRAGLARLGHGRSGRRRARRDEARGSAARATYRGKPAASGSSPRSSTIDAPAPAALLHGPSVSIFNKCRSSANSCNQGGQPAGHWLTATRARPHSAWRAPVISAAGSSRRTLVRTWRSSVSVAPSSLRSRRSSMSSRTGCCTSSSSTPKTRTS